MACKRSAVRSRYSPPKSTVLRRKYGAFFLLSWRSHLKISKCLILQAYGRQPPILAVSLFLKMLVRCPTVLQADVSLPLNVRSEIEVERDVDLVSAIYVYPADELVDDHLLRFKFALSYRSA